MKKICSNRHLLSVLSLWGDALVREYEEHQPPHSSPVQMLGFHESLLHRLILVLLLLADSLSHGGRGQRMGDEEEAQTEARQLCCLASGACPNTCTEELEWASPVMALCVVLHRSHWICQKTQEKDIPFQHGEGTSQLPEGLLRHTGFPTLQSLRIGGKPFHPTHRQRAD